ncbi:MAG: protein kinase [Bacteroidales bacterium]|nr:protein kinase [Bacteroidales bacterium]
MTQEEFFKRYNYNVRNDKIGGGGFGTVYKAYDNTLHREVAIKVSEVNTSTNGKVFSLKDEFDALAGLPEHSNIANYENLYTFEMPNGVFDYAVMQYYPDGNLSEAIRQGLTMEQKEDVALQLLDGIGFLHEHKVVHRDLKPGNVLIVRHSGKVIPLITDFGLSKTANSGDRSMFSNSFGGGTQRYSSPEQLQGKPLRFNTDLWSFGTILFELFTGKQLFTASTGATDTAAAELEIYNKIIGGNVQTLSGLPEVWRNVAERCLVIDPERRAKSVDELRSLLNSMRTVDTSDETNVDVSVNSNKKRFKTDGTSKAVSKSNLSVSQPPVKTDGTVDNSQRKKLLTIICGIAALIGCIGTTLFFALHYKNMEKKLITSNGSDGTSGQTVLYDTIRHTDTVIVDKGHCFINTDKMNVLYAGVANPISIEGYTGDQSVNIPGCAVSSSGAGKYSVSVPASLIGKTVTASVSSPDGSSSKKTFRVKKVPDPKAVLGAGIRGGKRAKAELLANPILRATMSDDFIYDLKWTVNSYRVIIVSKGMEEPAIVCTGSELSENAKSAIQKASANTIVFFSDIKVTSAAGSRTLDEFSVRIR